MGTRATGGTSVGGGHWSIGGRAMFSVLAQWIYSTHHGVGRFLVIGAQAAHTGRYGLEAEGRLMNWDKLLGGLGDKFSLHARKMLTSISSPTALKAAQFQVASIEMQEI